MSTQTVFFPLRHCGAHVVALTLGRPVQVRASQQLARVVVQDQVLKDQGAYNLEVEDAKHITKVLRCTAGDALELVDGTGRLQEVRLAAVERSTGRKPASAQVRSRH